MRRCHGQGDIGVRSGGSCRSGRLRRNAGTPDSIPDPGRDSAPLSEVRQDPERFSGEQVRWGGTITEVENRSDTTLVEIVARELDRGGRPRETDGSPGRFLAVIDGFLDPAIHETGRSMTITGTVDGTTTRPVGDHDYDYVRVRASGHHLWPKRELVSPGPYRAHPRGPFYDPWYDPWHDPWYPHRRGYRYY